MSTLHCVKTRTDNRRNNKPTPNAFQMFTTGIKVVTKSYSALEVSKHLELQWINVSQHKCFLPAQYTLWRPVWITWGPLNHPWMQYKCHSCHGSWEKKLESQQINVSQPEWILRVHYIAWRPVRATGGPINQLSMQSKCLPLTSKNCYKELKCFWSLKTFWITMNQCDST